MHELAYTANPCACNLEDGDDNTAGSFRVYARHGPGFSSNGVRGCKLSGTTNDDTSCYYPDFLVADIGSDFLGCF
eukprot:scaffold186950_cov23-Prasinocladus_malaysianus.AAC.1